MTRHITVLHRCCTHVTGQEEFLQSLRETLWHRKAVIVTGLAGVGKTTVVREYAARYAHMYRSVAWIDASSPETLLASMLELGTTFSLRSGPAQTPADVFQAVEHWLFEQPDFLLIMDNLAAPEATERHRPRVQARGHLVLITREPQPLEHFPCLTLQPLDEQHSALLLLRQAGLLSEAAPLSQVPEETRATALELARELHGLPLAINLAGLFMKEHNCTVADYLRAYRDYLPHLAAPGRSEVSSIRQSEICCKLAAASLDTRALELLRLCAFLAPAIPLSLLQQEVVLQKLGNGSDRPDSLPVLEAVETLQACGLLVRSSVADEIMMHPLLQDAVRQSLPLDWQQERVELALRAFYSLTLSAEKEPLYLRLRLVEHIRRLSAISEAWSISLDEAGTVLNWAGSLLWEQGLLREAEPLLNRGLAIWERTMGAAHPLVATLSLNLAVISAHLEHFTSSESLAQRAIMARTHALGINHPDVLLALNNLGRIYAHQQKDREARLCYEKAILLGERCKLENHPYYTMALYDLARLEIEQERFAEAEPLLQRVCAEQARGEETEQLHLYQIWQDLAEVSLRLEKWEQARDYFLRLLPIYQQRLGEQHSLTQKILEHLAEACARQGRFEEAAVWLQRILKTREHTAQSDQSEVAACLHGLASIYLAQQQHNKAFPLLEHARRIYEHQPETPALASVLENLAVIHHGRGKQAHAIDCLEQSLAIRERCQGPEHLDLVPCLSGLGTLYLEQGRLDEAEAQFQYTLGLYQRAEKPEDLKLDTALEKMALIALSRQRYGQARMYLDRLRGVREQALGRDSPDTAQALQKLAFVALAQEEWEQAERFYRHALSIYERSLGDKHAMTWTCLDELAALCVRLGRLEEAEELLRRMLAAREEESGSEHADLADGLLALGQICLARQRFVEAETCLRRVRALYNEVPQLFSPLSVLLLTNLSVALGNAGHAEQTRQQFNAGTTK
ncbi:MAG TPA: tetratricopeptide repeat protein [Ktedonobacteraceae bacterium]|nr:tetratricopeptide repeat protein [Ktedonobacteraceae bacterium]